VALGSQSLGYQHALGWLGCRSDVALAGFVGATLHGEVGTQVAQRPPHGSRRAVFQERLKETMIVLAREADKESAVFLRSLCIVQPLEGKRQHVGGPETEDLKLIKAWRGPG
jgi:hypothetical protein